MLGGAWLANVRAADATDAEVAARVVVLANSADAGSMHVARHYAGRRGIPAANIVALPMSEAETIGWPEFVRTIWQPLQDQLVREGWVGRRTVPGPPGAELDAMGRRRTPVSGHRISFLVVCRGVPLRIADAPELAEGTLRASLREEMRTNQAAVDGELALIALPEPPAAGFVPNVLFGGAGVPGAGRGPVVKVARLDGPSVEDALALVDRAIEAERTGLRGRAYIDIGGAHPSGDGWLETAAMELQRLGYDTDVERTPATLRMTARADAAAFYFGWYAGEVEGPFALPGYRFPAGAIAVHIHSYTAETVRSANRRWVGPLVARGVTATVGNVWEPYLEFTHHPDLLVRALARGERWGDAAFASQPVLGWQGVIIGDPLYRPFARPHPDQAGSAEPSGTIAYAQLREARLLKQAGRAAEATVLLDASYRRYAHAATAVALLSERPGGAGAAESRAILAGIRWPERIAASEWALAAEVARLLAAGGAPGPATALYVRLLAEPELPRELRLAWLERGRLAAVAAGDRSRAEAWARYLAELEARP